MSRLIEIDPQVQSEVEPEGYEFGYYTFDQLPALDVQEIQTSSQDDQNGDLVCELPIRNDVLIKLQQEDEFCKNIIQQIEKGISKKDNFIRLITTS